MNLVKSSLGLVLFVILWGVLPVHWIHPHPAGHAATGLAWLQLAASGVVGICIGDTFFFVSLARVGVRRTMALGLLAPVFAAAGAACMGQQLPGWTGAVGIALTLSGVFLVVRAVPLPAAGATSTARLGAVVFGLLSALCQAVGIVLTKDAISITGVVPASVIRLGAAVVGLLVIEACRPGRSQLAVQCLLGLRQKRLLGAAFLGTFVGFFLFQLAIQLGSPPVTAALVGTSPLFAAPLAARYLHERMPWTAGMATLLAVAGVAVIVWGQAGRP
jgi:drug/metabolite transporter (DMT)-like permease